MLTSAVRAEAWIHHDKIHHHGDQADSFREDGGWSALVAQQAGSGERRKAVTGSIQFHPSSGPGGCLQQNQRRSAVRLHSGNAFGAVRMGCLARRAVAGVAVFTVSFEQARLDSESMDYDSFVHFMNLGFCQDVQVC